MVMEIENDNSLLVVNGNNILESVGRHFHYELSDKKAKGNLVKGANREPIEFHDRQGCIMIDFSTGSYLEIVIPTIKEWENKNAAEIMDEQLSIRREGVSPGYDENMKHVEAIVRFFSGGNRVTVTCYNTTQRIKVEGKGYQKFLEQFFKPFLMERLNRIDPNKIDRYNKEVIAALSGKRKVVSRPVRSVRYKVMAKLDCSKCELSFLNEGQLKKHKTTMHTKGPNDSSGSFRNIPSIDNISLLDISEGVIDPPVSNNLQIEYVQEVNLNKTCVQVDQRTYTQNENVMHVPEDLKNAEKMNTSNEKLLDESKKENMEEIIDLDEAPHQEAPFSCNDCDYTATMVEDLNSHASVHINTKEISTDIEHHSRPDEIKQIPVVCHVCPFCKLQLPSLEELKGHIENTHTSMPRSDDEKIEVQENETCTDYVASDNELKEHIQVNQSVSHENVPNTNTPSNHIGAEHRPTRKDVSFPCQWCGLHFPNLSLLQDHTIKHHTTKPDHCQYCEKTFKSKDDLELHMDESHEEVVLLFTMARQVNVLTGEVAKYKDILKQVLDNQTEMKQELFIIRNEQTKMKNVNQESANTTLPKNDIDKKNDEPTKPFTACLIGDSISANIDHRVVERALGKKLRTARAYSSINDGAENEAKEATKFPDKNFDKIIKDELKKSPTDTLIIQAGSVDITNLKTTDDKLERFREYYKQETVVAANNLFSAVTDAVGTDPELKKVIIMKQIPRYDTKANDPSSVKALLSKLFNATLDQLLLKSEYQDRITIGTHRLECEGGIRDSRYRNKNRYDGIHMVGPSGKKAYTESVLCIIRSAGHVKNNPPRYFRRFHESVSQTKPEVTYFCPTQDTDYLNDRDVRTYAQVVRSPSYTVPTANRFSPLSQENY